MEINQRATILIVDDKVRNIQVLGNFLGLENYGLIIAKNGKEALEIVSEKKPEMILLDILMPEMDGFEVCRRLKEDPKTCDIPVIFISALSDEKDIVQGFELGGVDYITKPFKQEEVIQRVRTHLTLQKQRQELDIQRSFLEKLLNTIASPIFYMNLKGDIIGCNSEFCKLAQERRDDIVSKKLSDFSNFNLDTFFTDNDIQRIIANDGLTHEATILLGSSQKKDVILYNSVFYDNSNNPEGIISLMLDITERKRTEEQIRKYAVELKESKDNISTHARKLYNLNEKLLDSEKELKDLIAMKDKFFSIIAHDLKNPLGSFKSMTDQILDGFENFSQQDMKQTIENMQQTADNVYHLLENLLEWSRTQTGRIKFNPEPGDLNYIIDNTISIVNCQAESKAIELVKETDKDIHATFDINMITTVLRNIVSNAIKFTPVGGRITIRAHRKGNFIEVSVADTGVGIPKETMKKLFKIDEHISTKGTANESGTGLGLILTKEFITKSGGQVWVESHPGEGSTFYFTLPIVDSIN